MDAGAALRTFEAANAVQTTTDPALSLESFRRDLESNDAIFRFDNAAQNAVLNEKPWKTEYVRGARARTDAQSVTLTLTRDAGGRSRAERKRKRAQHQLLQDGQDLGGRAREDGGAGRRPSAHARTDGRGVS